jgi:hypothetical protein
MAIEQLRQEPMMEHLIDSLDQGKDIGHYGRLVFAMVARHFLSEAEVLEYLMKDQNCDKDKAQALLTQVAQRNYNPPKRERILEWQQRQKFPICNDPNDPAQCNVYRNLEFPDEIYKQIAEFYEQQTS